MKKIMILLAIVGLYATACAGTTGGGVQFQETSMKELMEQSAKSDKLIFVDVYADWCPPCRYMADSVFTKEKAGAYFNKEFINAKFDAEKGEGIDVARKYRVEAYPTFLVLDSTGKEVGRIVGGDEIDRFIQKVKQLIGTN